MKLQSRNQEVRALQPDIIINNRSLLPEDFSTPEGQVAAAEAGRGWEACMTFNHASWGYMPSAAEEGHSARDIIQMLNTACAGTGNLLMNIGPAPDGSVPPEAAEPLKTVGKWLQRNGDAVYGALDRAPARERLASACGGFSRKGKRLYFCCRFWPGTEFGLGGFKTRLESARFMVSGKETLSPAVRAGADPCRPPCGHPRPGCFGCPRVSALDFGDAACILRIDLDTEPSIIQKEAVCLYRSIQTGYSLFGESRLSRIA